MSWYGQAPNNPLASSSATHYGQQFPAPSVVNSKSTRNYSYAIAAEPLKIHKPPSYVVINSVGQFGFAYALTGSIGATLTNVAHGNLFITASIITDAGTAPVRLDISPSAWAGGGAGAVDEVVGDVTFVYKGEK